MELIAYLLIGLGSGVVAGLLGVGGGLIIVPLLLLSMPVAPAEALHVAVATSLVVIIPTAFSSTLAHARRGAVRWAAVWRMTPGLILGGLAGAALAGDLSRAPLQLIFASYTLLAALALWKGRRGGAGDDLPLPAQLELIFVGVGIGVISALVGIGGGTMTVPYLHWRGVGLHQAVATSAACGFPIALASAAGFMWLTAPSAPLAGATGFVYWPAALTIAISATLMAPLGARLAHRLPVATLKKILALVLVSVALRLLIDLYLRT